MHLILPALAAIAITAASAQESTTSITSSASLSSASASASVSGSVNGTNATSTSSGPVTHTVAVGKAGNTFQPDVTLAQPGDTVGMCNKPSSFQSNDYQYSNFIPQTIP